VVDVRSDYSKFQEARGEVLVVTMGTVAQVAAFRQRHDLPFHCLADPDRKAYQAYEVERGSLSQIVGPAVWIAGAKAFFKHGAGVPQQDKKQLQGAFIIDTAGTIRYRHSPANSAQNPTNDELLAVLREIEGDANVL